MYPDFKELLSILNARHVKYLVVGAYAVSSHAQPRATKDLDILVKRAEDVVDQATGLKANFISRADLITAKLAAGRPQDLADVDAIRRASEIQR